MFVQSKSQKVMKRYLLRNGMTIYAVRYLVVNDLVTTRYCLIREAVRK